MDLLPVLLLVQVTKQSILWSLIIGFKIGLCLFIFVTFLDNTYLLLEKKMLKVVSNKVTR